jgi:hypothetical protein
MILVQGHGERQSFQERLKGGVESRVNLSTHEKFNVTPTTFAEFARRNSAAFEAKFQRT